MEIKWQSILAAIINLVILVFILRHFFWDRIKKAIEERQNAINEKLLSADRAREEASKLKAENERILREAQEEGKKIIEARKKSAEEIYNKIVADAHAEAENLKIKANEQVKIDIEKAQANLKEQVIDLAIVLSKKAVEGSIDEAKHSAIIDEYIEKVGM
ncbi:F0F1 ATP synthase subunit B [Clostridium mediterraneense]|uniref:F0F1 ATP synthase subunit B n=1 Tax=Clostridium mediterraneense TaxID=1805472 RepID=UPI00082AD1FB|nr:F0F1 ATP synthase subunit B [Clostridium mediterraneense]